MLALLLEKWFQIEVNQVLLFILFYGLINLRFLSYMIPQILKRYPEHKTERMKRFDTFGISPREREVFDLISKGYSYRDTARILSVSLPTVKTHMDHLYRKTATNNKVELINEIDRP